MLRRKPGSTQQTQRPLRFACKASGSALSFMKQTSSLPIGMAPKLTWPKSGHKDFLLKALDCLSSIKSSRRRRAPPHHHHHRLTRSWVYISQDNCYSGPGRFKDKCWSAYATRLSCFFRVFWTELKLRINVNLYLISPCIDLFVLIVEGHCLGRSSGSVYCRLPSRARPTMAMQLYLTPISSH